MAKKKNKRNAPENDAAIGKFMKTDAQTHRDLHLISQRRSDTLTHIHFIDYTERNAKYQLSEMS